MYDLKPVLRAYAMTSLMGRASLAQTRGQGYGM